MPVHALDQHCSSLWVRSYPALSNQGLGTPQVYYSDSLSAVHQDPGGLYFWHLYLRISPGGLMWQQPYHTVGHICPSEPQRKHWMQSCFGCGKDAAPPIGLSLVPPASRWAEAAPGPVIFPPSTAPLASIFLPHPLGVNVWRVLVSLGRPLRCPPPSQTLPVGHSPLG